MMVLAATEAPMAFHWGGWDTADLVFVSVAILVDKADKSAVPIDRIAQEWIAEGQNNEHAPIELSPGNRPNKQMLPRQPGVTSATTGFEMAKIVYSLGVRTRYETSLSLLAETFPNSVSQCRGQKPFYPRSEYKPSAKETDANSGDRIISRSVSTDSIGSGRNFRSYHLIGATNEITGASSHATNPEKSRGRVTGQAKSDQFQ
ncbi:MAG: hypothetical protein KDA84_21365, partial [Planctomycetaceae bacterium]|nr:hypothetical protein [Planctomycetaceae bacterium]